MRVYAGIDLHSSNNYIGIIDEQDRRLYQKRLPNRLGDILPALTPISQKESKVDTTRRFKLFLRNALNP